MLLTLRVLW